MFSTLFELFHSMTRKSLTDYSNLEGPASNRILVYRNGTMSTIVKYQGIRRIVGDDETSQIITVLAAKLNQYLATGAHDLQMVFERDLMTTQRMKSRMRPTYKSAIDLGFDDVVSDILDEQAATMADKTMDDAHHLVLFTRPSAIRKEDHAEWVKSLIKQREEGLINVPAGTQDETYAIDPLIALHDAYVDQVVGALRDYNISALCKILECEEASNVMARAVDPLGTSESWKAWLLPTAETHIARRRNGEPLTEEATERVKKANPKLTRVANGGLFFPPPLKEQILSEEGSYTKEGGYFEYAGRIYATLIMTVAPRKNIRSTAFTNSLAGMQTRTPEGISQRVPYRLSIKLMGNGLRLRTFSRMLAPLVSAGSARNVKFMRAHSALNNEARNDMAIASLSLSLTTWVDACTPNAIQQLKQRIVALRSAATQWGDMKVVEETLDRAQAFLASAPGITLDACSPVEGVGTLADLLPLFPWGRPASPMGTEGSELYRSLDGALMTTESHSHVQDYWLDTITSPMGGGKSAQANRKHFDYVFAPGRKVLPFLHIMDIGGSVSGLVEMLQDALPEEKKYLVYMHTLRNNRENAINMLDCKLGLRYPLEGDLNTTVDWLSALVTPAERSTPYENMSEFCRVILVAAYKRLDDGRDQSEPRRYTPGTPAIDKALQDLRIDVKPGTTWYALCDQLGAHGRLQEALVAHRKAVPLLSDLQSVASDDNVRRDFMRIVTENGIPIPIAFTTQLALARESYPIFTEETRLDLRSRRITAIDLCEVTPQGSAPARKQASLMYQVSYELWARNVRLTQDDMPSIPAAWKSYYKALLLDMSNTDKHVAIDEYHRTMIHANSSDSEKDPDKQGLRATLVREGGREARKWGMSLLTISQESKDHGRLLDLASGNHIIKNSGVEETEFQTRSLALTTTDQLALKHLVSGPKKGEGVTFLSRFDTKDGKYNQLYTSTVGPRMLWALSSTYEDKTVRKLVYDALGRTAGRYILAKQYPGGTAKDEVRRRKSSISSNLTEAAAEEGACKQIADELIAIFRSNPISMD